MGSYGKHYYSELKSKGKIGICEMRLKGQYTGFVSVIGAT